MGVQYGKVMKVNHQIYERYCWYQITKIWGYQRQLFLSEFIYVIKFTSKTHLCFILISLKDSFDWRRKKKHCLDDTQKHCKPFSSLPSSTRPRKSAAGLGYDLYPPPHPPSKSLTGPSHGLFLPILSLVLSLGYPAASLICSAPGWVGRSGLANLLLIHLIFFHFILTVQQMYVIIQSVEFRYYSLTHSAKRTLCSTEQCLFLLIQSCEHYYG